MAKCQYCGKEVALPYRCHYCGGIFCVEHHLPEKHNCPGLKRGSWDSRAVVPPIKIPTTTAIPVTRKPSIFSFTEKELQDLFLSIIVVSLVYLSIIRFNLFFFPFVLLAVILAFVLHEIAHRTMARKLGFIARYVADRRGLLLTLLSIFFPIKIIAPGAVVIVGYPGLEEEGLIALAGPLTNIFLSYLGIMLFYASPPTLLSVLAYVLAKINADVAIFNLLPIGILDGRKIYRWNVKTWAVFFVIALGMWLYLNFFF